MIRDMKQKARLQKHQTVLKLAHRKHMSSLGAAGQTPANAEQRQRVVWGVVRSKLQVVSVRQRSQRVLLGVFSSEC